MKSCLTFCLSLLFLHNNSHIMNEIIQHMQMFVQSMVSSLFGHGSMKANKTKQTNKTDQKKNKKTNHIISWRYLMYVFVCLTIISSKN